MTAPFKSTHPRFAAIKLRTEIATQIATCTVTELEAALAFIKLALQGQDPDTAHEFLQWRQDPRIESVLQIAASLDDDMRDQLLFAAEDLYSNQALAEKEMNATAAG